MMLDSEYSGELCSADRSNNYENILQNPALRIQHVGRVVGKHITSFHSIAFTARRDKHVLPGST